MLRILLPLLAFCALGKENIWEQQKNAATKRQSVTVIAENSYNMYRA